MLESLGCFSPKRQPSSLPCKGWRPLLPFSLALALAGLEGAPARGATVVKIHSDGDKLLLSLSDAEMLAIAADQPALLESGNPRFRVGGWLRKLNQAKKTIVFELPEEDERFEIKQQVTFVPLIHNLESSLLVTSAAQFPAGSHAMVEGGVGGFFEGQQETEAGDKGGQTASGGRLTAHTYLVLNSPLYGFNLDYEHRVASATIKPVGASSTMSMHLDQLKPSGWLEVAPSWRLGLAYDYTVIVQAYSGDTHGSYQFSVARPIATILSTDATSELGLDLMPSHNAGASADWAASQTQTNHYDRLYKAPAEAYAHYRWASSPTSTWGAGLGYLLFERTQGPGQPLEPKATIPQLLRVRFSYEERNEEGERIEWMLSYDGGKTRGLSTLELTANEIGLQVSYQTQVKNKWICGLTVDVGGGLATLSDNAVDASGNVSQVDRKVIGYRAGLLAFANYALDPLLKKGRRP